MRLNRSNTMRPIRQVIEDDGAQAAIPLDNYISPFNVGFGVTISDTATVEFTVEHTFDDVQDSAVTPVWFPHPTVVDQIANANGNYAFPVTAVRLNVTDNDGTITFTVIQAGLAR
jgi:hypothetical protein